MISLQNSYRLRRGPFRGVFAIFAFGFSCLYAQQIAKPDAAQNSQAPQANSVVAEKQAVSVAAMSASADKQRASAQAQIGSKVPSDAFFTSAWTTAAALAPPNIIPTCSAMAEDELKPMIEESAKATSLKAELIRAVIRRESASYPCAVSEKGALGLMQLLPETAGQFGADPLDPKQNVNAGSQYLKKLMDRYKGDVKLALAAYNAGPERVDAEGKVPAIPETMAYVEAILKDLAQSSTHR